MPDSVLTPLGHELIGSLPPILRRSLHYRGVCHVIAKESEFVEEHFEEARRQLFPQSADVLLKAHEAQLGIAVEQVGMTINQRRLIVLAHIAKMAGDPSGRTWEDNVTAVVGQGWVYREHVPGDVTSPPAYTIRIILPFGPTTIGAYAIEAFIRDVTPAHLDLQIQYEAGFILDQSQLDQEGMHY